MEFKSARNGAELLVQSLEAQGVEYIFGVPGGAVLPILDVLADHGPKFIVCRHETGAAFMAQAWGRVTGKPGVVLTTSGPGLINSVCGVSTATEDRDPLVIITGQVPRALRFKQSHMNVDTVNLFAPITKWSIEAEEPNSIPEIVANAFRIAARSRPGSVHISMPVDVSTSAVTATPIPAGESPRLGAAAAEALDRAATLLNGATFPVMLLGVSAGGPAAADAVRRLIRKHPLPVIGTFEAAGVVPRDLVDRFVGRVGYVRNQPGDLVLQKADVILTIGYDRIEYDPTAWNVSGKAQIIHVDENHAGLDRAYRPAVELPGDIARNLDGLSERMRLSAAGEWAEVAAARKVLLDEQAKGATLSGSPIHPLRFIHDLRRTIGDDVTVTCDTGAHEIWMARYFFSYEPRRLLFSMGHQTMGVALPLGHRRGPGQAGTEGGVRLGRRVLPDDLHGIGNGGPLEAADRARHLEGRRLQSDPDAAEAGLWPDLRRHLRRPGLRQAGRGLRRNLVPNRFGRSDRADVEEGPGLRGARADRDAG